LRWFFAYVAKEEAVDIEVQVDDFVTFYVAGTADSCNSVLAIDAHRLVCELPLIHNSYRSRDNFKCSVIYFDIATPAS